MQVCTGKLFRCLVRFVRNGGRKRQWCLVRPWRYGVFRREFNRTLEYLSQLTVLQCYSVLCAMIMLHCTIAPTTVRIGGERGTEFCQSARQWGISGRRVLSECTAVRQTRAQSSVRVHGSMALCLMLGAVYSVTLHLYIPICVCLSIQVRNIFSWWCQKIRKLLYDQRTLLIHHEVKVMLAQEVIWVTSESRL